MKWFRALLEKIKGLAKKNKNTEEEQVVNARGILEESIAQYKIVNLSSFEDKNSYEYLVAQLRNEAKQLFTLNHYRELSIKLWEMSEQADRTLLVMIMGEFKTGKSTFINAILGEEVLKSDVTPATAVVTMLSYGEEKKVLVHFKDGTELVYSIGELADLTAEGDSEKAQLRDSIKYVELFLPQPLLKKLTIVDTPGLNVDNNKHIEATKEFMNNADLVLWVFAAGKAASRTELAAIRDLNQRMKPMAIINRIDEIDEEEESIEEVISEIQDRLKDTVESVIGISAFLAKKGQVMSDECLLKESNWSAFKIKFDEDIVSKSEELKMKATLAKLKEFMSDLKQESKNKEEQLRELDEKVNHREEYVAKQEEFLRNLTDGIQKMKSYIKNKARAAIYKEILEEALAEGKERIYEGMYEPLNILLWVEEFIGIFEKEDIYIERIKAYKGMWDKVNDDFERLGIQRDTIKSEEDKVLAEMHIWESDVDKYNTSGLFGGAPLLDLSGNGDKLRKRQKEFQQEAERVDERWNRWRSFRSNICIQIVRFNKEMYQFIEDEILNNMKLIKEEIKQDLNKLGEEVKETEALYKQFINDKAYITEIIERLDRRDIRMIDHKIVNDLPLSTNKINVVDVEIKQKQSQNQENVIIRDKYENEDDKSMRDVVQLN